MMIGKFTSISLVVLATWIPCSGAARAEEEFELTVSKDEITVVCKGHWHVNHDYPWKVVVGDVEFDRSKFVFTETSAKLSGVPPGAGRIKGAVCDGPQCLPFSKGVTVR